MIATLVEDIYLESIEVIGESFTHLNSSLRIKSGDEILVLDGKGQKRQMTVESIEKKKIILSGGEVQEKKRSSNIDLLLSPPKRDAFNDCLRAACELGIRNIYLFDSEYTQFKKIDLERSRKILTSSLIQSNNSFMPKLFQLENDLNLEEDYDESFIFHLDGQPEQSRLSELERSGQYLVVLGPEGGFSDGDLDLLKGKFSSSRVIQLETAILRTPTALCTAYGWVISKFKNLNP